MCLKEYHRFTFSNTDAMMRAVDHVSFLFKESPWASICGGSVNVITRMTDRDAGVFSKHVRDELSYDELLYLARVDTIGTEALPFSNLEGYQRAVKMGLGHDCFGEVEVELR